MAHLGWRRRTTGKERPTVYEHKLVLFEKLGGGDHPCHWCGRLLRWVKGTAGDALVADHLDGDRRNNEPANLVPACNGCNTIRARSQFRPKIREDEAFVVHGEARTRAESLVCEECGVTFLADVARVKRGTAKVCSTSCAGKRGSRRRWEAPPTGQR